MPNHIWWILDYRVKRQKSGKQAESDLHTWLHLLAHTARDSISPTGMVEGKLGVIYSTGRFANEKVGTTVEGVCSVLLFLELLYLTSTDYLAKTVTGLWLTGNGWAWSMIISPESRLYNSINGHPSVLWEGAEWFSPLEIWSGLNWGSDLLLSVTQEINVWPMTKCVKPLKMNK